jgi:hypothetical protein
MLTTSRGSASDQYMTIFMPRLSMDCRVKPGMTNLWLVIARSIATKQSRI